MARIRIRYLVEKSGARGTVRRYWQPADKLKTLGWQPLTLEGPQGFLSRAEAIEVAEWMNDRLDAWRDGAPFGAPCPVDDFTHADREQPDRIAPQKGKRRAGAPAASRRAPKAGTIGALAWAWKNSNEWRDTLSPASRASYESALKKIEAWGGDLPWRAVTPQRIRRTLYNPIRETRPSMANLTVATLGALFKWARQNVDGVTVNPVNDVERQGAPRQKPVQLWHRPLTAHMVATADRMGWHSIGTAFTVNEWLGQRLPDVLTLTKADFRHGRFEIEQQKTGAEVHAMHSPAVSARCAEEIARHEAAVASGRWAALPTGLIVMDSTGRPWNPGYFQECLRRIREEAAQTMPECAALTFHKLRHTAVYTMAMANISVPLIASVTGHSLASAQKIIDVYLPRTRELTNEALRLRLEYETANSG